MCKAPKAPKIKTPAPVAPLPPPAEVKTAEETSTSSRRKRRTSLRLQTPASSGLSLPQ